MADVGSAATDTTDHTPSHHPNLTINTSPSTTINTATTHQSDDTARQTSEPLAEVQPRHYVSPQITPTKPLDPNDYLELLNATVAPNSPTPITNWRTKLVLVLVGLPARGKSFIAYKTVTYLRWRGMKADLFNVGKMRRKQATVVQDAAFFDSNNAAAKQQREQLAIDALNMLLDWLSEEGDVGVFDATNTTADRRARVMRTCKRRSPLLNVVFVESVCDDEDVLEANYKEKASHSPDYKDMKLEDALVDLKLRVQAYEKVYEPITNDNTSYIKLINLSAKVICNKVFGALAHGIAAYLMSIHIQPRPIYLVRCGHAAGADENDPADTNDVVNLKLQRTKSSDGEPHIPYTLSLDAKLDDQGKIFSKLLSDFLVKKCTAYWQEHDELWHYIAEYLQLAPGVPDEHNNGGQRVSDADRSASSPTSADIASPQKQGKQRRSSSISTTAPRPQLNAARNRLPLTVYTSTAPRAEQTAAPVAQFAQFVEQHSSLNMLDMGELHGKTIYDIRKSSPQILSDWAKDRYEYRWPGGESQKDKARALVPLIMELERQRFPVLLVSHASTLQVLYGYFMGLNHPTSEYYALNIPQDIVIELTPSQYGWIERRYDFRADVKKVLEKQRTKRATMSRQNSAEGCESPMLSSKAIGERTLGLHHYA